MDRNSVNLSTMRTVPSSNISAMSPVRNHLFPPSL